MQEGWAGSSSASQRQLFLQLWPASDLQLEVEAGLVCLRSEHSGACALYLRVRWSFLESRLRIQMTRRPSRGHIGYPACIRRFPLTLREHGHRLPPDPQLPKLIHVQFLISSALCTSGATLCHASGSLRVSAFDNWNPPRSTAIPPGSHSSTSLAGSTGVGDHISRRGYEGASWIPVLGSCMDLHLRHRSSSALGDLLSSRKWLVPDFFTIARRRTETGPSSHASVLNMAIVAEEE